MDFEELFKELKVELTQLFVEKWDDLTDESKSDINTILNSNKEKLKRWTTLLTEGSLDLNDFEWLLKSQKDLMQLKAIQTKGISKISIGHFKNKIISTIINVVKVAI